MAKDKSTKVAAPAAKVSKDAVKAGRVTKSADSAKNVSKKTAKDTAKAVEKKSKKVKEPTPEPSSDEEEDDNTSASSDSSEDDSDEEPQTNGKKAFEADSDASDSDDSEDDSEDEKPAPAKSNGKATKANGVSKAKAAKDDDSSEEDDSSDEDDEDDDDVAAAPGATNDDEDSDDSSDEESDEEEEKPAAKDSKKRKAEDSGASSAKKTKYTVNGEEKDATPNLWVGQLSWNVDDDWLRREFEEFGEIVSARVMTERDSGRSKGFGYVEFSNAEDAGKALEARQGYQIDNRNINVDFSTPRSNDGGNNFQQRGADRAKKFGDQTQAPSTTLFVGNLAFGIDQNTVSEVFQEYGTVNGVRLPTDRETGELKGFGYVEMASIDEAKSALEALQGADVNGRPMRLDFAGQRPERPEGGRGGFGGRGGGRGGSFGGRGGRGGFGDRGGRGGFGGRGGGRGGARGGRGNSTNRGGFGDFSGQKKTF